MLGLCEKDPIVSLLRETFGQNIVRVPEERLKPLSVLARREKQTVYRGELRHLLDGSNVALPVPTEDSVMGNVSKTRSRAVELRLGMSILEGFLGGFGIPSAGVEAAFKGARKVAFSFADAKRFYVDTNLLGRVLMGRKIDRQNPAADLFFGQYPYALLVIDSATTSSNFTMSVEESSSASFEIDVPLIQTLVAKAKGGVSISGSSSTSITFQGSVPLTFAFSCVRFRIDSVGRVASLLPDADIRSLTRDLEAPGRGKGEPTPSADPFDIRYQYAPDRVLLSAKPAMIDISSGDAAPESRGLAAETPARPRTKKPRKSSPATRSPAVKKAGKVASPKPKAPKKRSTPKKKSS